ncbi:MAG: IS66 family insertion sequence element accessory protein TnpB [Planctomycetes bacterium]|nr:IS66 family insertion sequence element accessory protein TnpB [Planctomycetota bacterium]
MKMFVEPDNIYLHCAPVDFRKSINGLALIVEQSMALNPYSEGLFLFTNKGKDKLKILYWDRSGFALWYKRLEKERFKWPGSATDVLGLTSHQLNALLDGYSIIGHQPLVYTEIS